MKKVQVDLTATEQLSRVASLVLEIPDDLDELNLLALDPAYLEGIANECAVDWHVEDSDWLGVGTEGVGVVTVPDTDQTHARLVWGEDGKIGWQKIESGPKETSLASRIRRMARAQNLIAQKSRKDGLWYFADEKDRLLSPEDGLASPQALAWLRQQG